MTPERFYYVLHAIHLAIGECYKNEKWERLEMLSRRYGGNITLEEIRYVLENPIVDIIGQLRKETP